MEDMKKYLAEMMGTFCLVLIGCGSAAIAGEYIGFVGISFAFGLTVLVMVYTIGHISGCHINPAITISMLVAKKIKSKDAVGYIIFQFVGAVVAAGVIYLILSGETGFSNTALNLGQNGYGSLSPGGFSMMACFVAEVVLTGIFLFVIFGSTSDKAPKGFAGLSIGFSLVLIHLIGIPITGTSVNPARSFGPAVLVGGEALSQLWLFIVAPIIGGIIAAVAWKYIFEEK